jgi:hypothetical protein
MIYCPQTARLPKDKSYNLSAISLTISIVVFTEFCSMDGGKYIQYAFYTPEDSAAELSAFSYYEEAKI